MALYGAKPVQLFEQSLRVLAWERNAQSARCLRVGGKVEPCPPRADIFENVPRVDETGDAQAVSRFIVLNGVAAGNHAAGLHRLVAPVLQNGADAAERKAVQHAECTRNKVENVE